MRSLWSLSSSKESTSNAFEILDVSDETANLIFSGKRYSVKITNKLLISALAIDFSANENCEPALIIRTVFDDFLNDLSIFQSHVDSGLIKLRDIRPYLSYWIRELTGRGEIQKDEDFGRQVARYCKRYGDDPLLQLAREMGSPFPPVEDDSPVEKENLADHSGKILDAIADFETCLDGAALKSLTENNIQRKAAERAFEIICRSARRLPAQVREDDKEIDWRGFERLETRLRVFYYCDCTDALLKFTKVNLPLLKEFAKRIASKFQPGTMSQ